MTEQTVSSKGYILYRFVKQTGIMDIFSLDLDVFLIGKMEC